MKFVSVLSLLLMMTAGYVAASEDVVIRTESFEVTVEDFDMYLVERNVSRENRARMLSQPGSVSNIFENLYVIKALAAEGEKNSEINRKEIEWMVENYRERLLMNKHLDLEVTKLMEAVDWESAAREEFTANRKDYVRPESVNADHILIRVGDRDEDEARALAEDVLAKARAGDDFNALAEEYSEDTVSAERGGNLGYFGRGQMVAPFEVAAFALGSPNDISDLVESEFGFHIIRLVEKQPEQQMAFDEVREDLIASLQQRRQGQIRSSMINDVRSGAVDLGLEVNVELLNQLERRYESEPDEE